MNNKVFNNDILDSKVAFLTGGGTGITGGVARALAEHGAKVAITSRKMETLGPKECPTPAPSAPEYCNISSIKIHEIGHLFGVEHGMGGVIDDLTTNFSDESLAVIRGRTYP